MILITIINGAAIPLASLTLLAYVEIIVKRLVKNKAVITTTKNTNAIVPKENVSKLTSPPANLGSEKITAKKLVVAEVIVVNPNAKIQTSLEASVESHLMALCAEESRKSGKVVKIHQENN